MYLRIALELHLKRLIVGGLERVFEIGRVFRNEGIDTRHNPEFTMLEAYQAFADYHDMMDLVEGMIIAAARAALGDELVVHYGGHAIDLAATPWPRLRFADMIAEKTGERMHPGMPIDEARAVLDRLGLGYQRGWGAGRLMKEVYDEKVQHDVVGPVFCIDYPREVSPLARVHRDDPDYVERFELIVAGFELCNAYSEQNDPVEQLAAFEAEARAKAGGDPEAGDIDLDYIRALEHGMPCTGGLGIGIDRLVMLLASVDSIREVILFPTLRPEFAARPGAGPSGAPRPVLPPTPVGAGAVVGPASADGRRDGAAGRSSPCPTWRRPPTRSRRRRAPGARARPEGGPVMAVLTALGGVLQLLTQMPIVHSRLDGQEAAIGPLWVPVTGHVVSAIVGLTLLLLADQLAKRKRLAWRVAVVLFARGRDRARDQGPAPGGHHVLRRHAAGPVPVPAAVLRARPIPRRCCAWSGSCRSTWPACCCSGWSRSGWSATASTRTLTLGRGAADHRRRPGRAGRPVHLPLAVLRRVLPGGADRARDRRSGRVRGAAVPAAGRAATRTPRTTGSTPTAWCAPTAGTPWPTSRCATTRASSSPPTARPCSPTPTSAATRWSPATRSGPASRWSGCSTSSWPCATSAPGTRRSSRSARPACRSTPRAASPASTSATRPILDCARFTLAGPARKSLRAAVRRVGRSYTFQLITESERGAAAGRAAQRDQRQVAGQGPGAGLHHVAQPGRGRGRGEPGVPALRRPRRARACPAGSCAWCRPTARRFGYTLDLMRHDPGAPNGMTEFLIASTAPALGQRGVRRLSMNFAMWGRLFADDIPFSRGQRAARWAVGVINPFFQIKSLHDFNAKFDPEWLPRVLAYRRAVDLPRVGLLYAGAEGFLALPVIGELLVPRAVGGVEAPSAPERGLTACPPRQPGDGFSRASRRGRASGLDPGRGAGQLHRRRRSSQPPARR